MLGGLTAGSRTRLGLKISLGMLPVLTVSCVIMVVSSIIVTVYTLDQRTISTCREIQRAGAIHFITLATVPLAMLVISSVSSSAPLPQAHRESHKKRFKYFLHICIVCPLCSKRRLQSRCGMVVWAPSRSLFDPARYHDSLQGVPLIRLRVDHRDPGLDSAMRHPCGVKVSTNRGRREGKC